MTVLRFDQVLAQAAAVPLPIQVWVLWMVAVLYVIPLAFLGDQRIRIYYGWQLLNAVANIGILFSFGVVRLMSLPHLLFWIPASIVLLRCRDEARGSAMKAWMLLALVTMAISLAFDVVDVIRYAAGARSPIGQSPP